jgi:hypothetical protein
MSAFDPKRTWAVGDQRQIRLTLKIIQKSREEHAMNYAKTPAYTLLFCFFSTCWTAIPKDVAAAEIDWQKYIQSSANVSAIAAAVAFVDGCSKNLDIEESSSDGKVRLSFTCDGKEDEEGTAVIEFESFGDGPLMPKKFEFAG